MGDLAGSGMDLSKEKAVGTGLRDVQGLRRAAVSHLALRHDLRLVDMPKGDVGKWRQFQAVVIHGQMGGIPAVSHEDLDAVV